MVEDLEKMREEKLKEMKKKLASKTGQKGEMQKRVEKMKKVLLRRFLTKEARERLGRVRLAHPNLAKRAETAILQTIRLRGKEERINDEELKKILKKLS